MAQMHFLHVYVGREFRLRVNETVEELAEYAGRHYAGIRREATEEVRAGWVFPSTWPWLA